MSWNDFLLNTLGCLIIVVGAVKFEIRHHMYFPVFWFGLVWFQNIDYTIVYRYLSWWFTVTIKTMIGFMRRNWISKCTIHWCILEVICNIHLQTSLVISCADFPPHCAGEPRWRPFVWEYIYENIVLLASSVLSPCFPTGNAHLHSLLAPLSIDSNGNGCHINMGTYKQSRCLFFVPYWSKI